jgi:hypothetical protein
MLFNAVAVLNVISCIAKIIRSTTRKNIRFPTRTLWFKKVKGSDLFSLFAPARSNTWATDVKMIAAPNAIQ